MEKVEDDPILKLELSKIDDVELAKPSSSDPIRPSWRSASSWATEPPIPQGFRRRIARGQKLANFGRLAKSVFPQVRVCFSTISNTRQYGLRTFELYYDI